MQDLFVGTFGGRYVLLQEDGKPFMFLDGWGLDFVRQADDFTPIEERLVAQMRGNSCSARNPRYPWDLVDCAGSQS